MTISNGSTVLSSDLLAMNTSALNTYQAWLERDPDYFCMPIQFRNVISTTAEIYRTARIVLVDNYTLADVLIQGGDTAGTVTVTMDNGLLVAPLEFTATFTSPAINKATRYYPSSGVYSLYKPLQILNKGSILDVVVTNTDTSGAHNLQVCLGLTSPLRRL